MGRMRCVVTGGAGFIGRRPLDRILGRLERLAQRWDERVQPIVGDLTAPDLGLTEAARW